MERVPELAQHLLPVQRAGGDVVEAALQRGRERGLHVPVEEGDQKGADQPAAILGHEALALEAHIVAVLQHRDDAGVGRGPADAELLELAHQARLGKARRRLGEMLLGHDLAALERIARRHRRQQAALVLVARRIVAAFLIELQETVEGHGLAGRAKAHAAVGRGEVGDHPVEQRARHLARHGALPDQLVEAALVVVEPAPDDLRRAREIGRPDRLVRLLGVLGPGAIGARLVRQVALAVGACDPLPAGGERLAGHLHAVGAHVGDQADRLAIERDALEQALRGAHRAIGAEAELARRFLLQGRGRERRRRMALHLALLEALDREVARLDRGDRALRVRLVGEVELVELPVVEPGQARA